LSILSNLIRFVVYLQGNRTSSRFVSICKIKCGVAKESVQTTSVCVAKRRHCFSIFCCFYGDPVENLQIFPFCSVLRSEIRLHLMCGFMF
jgi:hypothetical protein